MSETSLLVDDPAALQRILANTDALLLDFDGPVCSVFANFPAPVVAEHLREILAEGGHSDVPLDIARTNDPFDIFKYAAHLGADEATYIEAALRAYEAEAVTTAEPTAGAHQLFPRWTASGRKLAIVSNNSAAAVETYLYQHGLMDHVTAVVGRSSSDPALLKPDAHLVMTALDLVATPANRCTFVGDSESDMVAARAAGTVAVGYANKAGKSRQLAIAGADLVLSAAYPAEIR
jgi:phosphoglycolate phosphatase